MRKTHLQALMPKNALSVYILIALSCSTLFADDSAAEDLCFIPTKPIDCCNPSPAGIFLPAAYNVECGFNLFATVEFLYWVSGQTVNNIATRVKNTPPGLTGPLTTVQESASLLHPFKFKPGFKIEAGMDLPCFDNIELSASYTWYHATTDANFYANTNEGERIEPLAYFAGSPYFIPSGLPTVFPDLMPGSSHLKSQFTMHWNLADLAVSRPMYLSKRIIINPRVGLKGYWLKQKYNLHFDGNLSNLAAPATHITEFKAWAIGPHLGLDLKNLLPWGLYFGGKADFLLPYVRMYGTQAFLNFPGIIVPTPTIQKAKSCYLLQPVLEAGAGLGWSSYLACNRYHVDFYVGYEFIATWVAIHPLETPEIVPSNFNLRGLNIKAQFNF